ncbi:biosynthetic arginine decarboxylase [Mesoterricola silvestris]|uniref:Arginine decarboxylase n=1 Tax=Mesoterricola silvestris TaxID=2927979 RepID=A0AA48K9K0_9BACT|nr:biosynthetic arginine decarboxylase [Mesoterricola silvestris]BDU72412.1 biosynthetic arginine decarboxylase [Mesoterricola silvestris]
MAIKNFTVQDAMSMYGVKEWGYGFFGVNSKGHLVVHPTRDENLSCDVFDIVQHLRKKGVDTPLILRFPQILAARVTELNEAFHKAMREYDYAGSYQGVYPVKTNQIKEVVDQVVKAGYKYRYGLEAGSKPELMIALSMNLHPDALVTCNGYKDETFMRMALLARKAGRNVLITVEKMTELPMILKVARELKVEPLLGLRFKLNAMGSGKWESSAGDHSKFGLNTQELLEAVETLEKKGLLDSVVELHFHIGSQITDIRRVKTAMKEATRMYAKLYKRGVPLKYLNVGGGLGVDYDGSRTTFSSSMNYTIDEYASDVVYTTQDVCAQEQVPVPNLLSESGRAIAAFHEVVVVDIIGLIDTTHTKYRVELTGNEPQVLKELAYTRDNLSVKNFAEMYHDAITQKDELITLFNLGYLSLDDRAKGEILFWEVCRKLSKIFSYKSLKYIPEEFQDLSKSLADKLIANFSLFQSMPDHWAIDQLFPVMPIHRLKEKPTISATLCDITCDSDGKMEKFIDLKDVRDEISLHEPKGGEPYYLAFFLTGAYQDILGMRHNLFGAPTEAHVVVNEDEDFKVQQIIPGDTMDHVLRSVHYDPDELVEGPTRRRQNKSDAGEALKALLTQQRSLPTYLDTNER